jgi:hypothetical protein
MARKSKKLPGALVELPARKKKGLGVVLKIATHQEAYDIYQYCDSISPLDSDIDVKLSENQMRLASAFGYYGMDSYSGEALPRGVKRKYALVKWIKPPSEWSTDTMRIKEDWYPLSIVRVVSEVIHTEQ